MLENFVSHLKLKKEEILKKAHERIEIEKRLLYWEYLEI